MTHRPSTFLTNRLDVSDLPHDGYVTTDLEHWLHLALLVVTAVALVLLLLTRVGAPR